LLIVQYKGTGASLADLVGGQVALSFGSLPGLAPFVKAGKLRALARWKKVIASANIRAE